MRPALKLNNKLLKWEGGETRTSSASQGTNGSYTDDNDIINIRVLFETGVKQPATSILQFQNVGTTSIYYNWKVHVLTVYQCSIITCTCIQVSIKAFIVFLIIIIESYKT